MNHFVAGKELNRAFYAEAVAPLITEWEHGAALMGWGSDVLGYDTPRSTDHGWGPRLQVFVAPVDIAAVRQAIDAGIPAEFDGWPVRYGWDDTPVRHHVEVTTLGPWLHRHLGRDPQVGMSTLDWLLTSQQQLVGVAGGAVYHDEWGELGAVRRSLHWYPDDVWRWIIACQWHRVAQEEAFTGRTAEVGDDLGSRLVASRLVRELMRLGFLFSRVYWPYAKWFGTAFAELPVAPVLDPLFGDVLRAENGTERDRALGAALEGVATAHNEAAITDPVDPNTRHYHSREFRVLMADRFTDACMELVSDPALRDLPLVGSVDQFIDSTDVLQFPERVNELRLIYGMSQTRSGPSALNP